MTKQVLTVLEILAYATICVILIYVFLSVPHNIETSSPFPTYTLKNRQTLAKRAAMRYVYERARLSNAEKVIIHKSPPELFIPGLIDDTYTIWFILQLGPANIKQCKGVLRRNYKTGESSFCISQTRLGRPC